jgi:hypothetical protein
MCAARHLTIDNGRVAGNVFSKVAANELRGYGKAAGLCPDDDRNGFAFVEVCLRECRRGDRQYAGNQRGQYTCV